MTEIAIAERVRAASEEEKTLNRKEPSAAGAATKIRNVSRKGAKAAKKAYCHFDRREKSFLDPSHLLGMAGLARHLASWREQIPVLDSHGPPENLRKPRKRSHIAMQR